MACGALVLAGAAAAAFLGVRRFLLHDSLFRIESSSSIQILGNSHVTRPELLSTFGEDIGRNIFYVPLAQRRTDLESLPWVERATVMRLLPDRLRVSVVERTPIAFVRQGSHIGLVDANGVLLDMAATTASHRRQDYSFPVVVGISSSDPLSTRAARMKIFQRFTDELDATGENISHQLSEVDLSEPEDVRALIFDKDADILVHFGDVDFLDRYHSFEAHLAEWRQQYPHLSSVDMRYPRQVVLEMQPGTSSESANATADATADGQEAAQPATATQEKSSAQAKATGSSRSSKFSGSSENKANNLSRASATASPSGKTKGSGGDRALTPGKAASANSASLKPQPRNAAHTAAVTPVTTAQNSQPVETATPPKDPLQAADSRLSRKAQTQHNRHRKPAKTRARSAVSEPNTATPSNKTATAAQSFAWTPNPAGKGAVGKHSAAHPIATDRLSEKQHQTTAAGQGQ